MWDGQAAALAQRYRVVRFDNRGHGESPVPESPYSMAELVADVLDMVDRLGVGRFGYVGLSLGGLVGQAVAVEHPDRVAALVLCCTGPSFGDPATWRERAAKVRSEGMAWLVEPSRQRWFTAEFVEAEPEQAQRLLDMVASVSPEGYAGCCDAIADSDLRDELGTIKAPTRVIAGSEDPVMSPEVAQTLADGIAGADLVVIEGASHIANVAVPQPFTEAVLEHLDRHL